jgi:hypothetical protein
VVELKQKIILETSDLEFHREITANETLAQEDKRETQRANKIFMPGFTDYKEETQTA